MSAIISAIFMIVFVVLFVMTADHWAVMTIHLINGLLRLWGWLASALRGR